MRSKPTSRYRWKITDCRSYRTNPNYYFFGPRKSIHHCCLFISPKTQLLKKSASSRMTKRLLLLLLMIVRVALALSWWCYFHIETSGWVGVWAVANPSQKDCPVPSLVARTFRLNSPNYWRGRLTLNTCKMGPWRHIDRLLLTLSNLRCLMRHLGLNFGTFR